MAIRIEVQPDGIIEVMRPDKKSPEDMQFLYWTDLARAERVICYLLRQEHARVLSERFVTQAEKETRKAWRQMEEKANAVTRAARTPRR